MNRRVLGYLHCVLETLTLYDLSIVGAMNNLAIAILCIASLMVSTYAFRPNSRHVVRSNSATSLEMGLFDNLFGPKKTASASHILVKGDNAKVC